MDKDLIFITLSNDGYVDYTLNCIESLKKIGMSGPKVYTIGEQSFQKFKEQGVDCEKIGSPCTNFQVYRQGNWHNIVSNKFKIIYDNLLKYKYVLITDGDIIYLNQDFISYCLESIGNNDLLIQNNTLSDKDKGNLCTGFMLIKSSDLTKRLFNFETVKKHVKKNWGDQSYINRIKRNLKYKLLPLNLFPNGRYFRRNSETINPYMIHFNWVKGHKKKLDMEKYEKWYLEQ